ncbi:AfsR/SARP family transcriptional regulator [Streptomyces paludis]|uniref:AfsR/SARP family transcriptional regulator n=1 Tax=Streptomyces paludis TaxID=2282738 RepID=A0A345HIB5_9ACTN|nr:BTAD domain-containing putative transcriptional regulator [Streptomyces paludis]AXG76439.1 AfsR/SARP family transcriptional regulator [Streptomyces paludis]
MSHFYRVLGVTRALRQDGTEVPLSGARLRALLTALAAAGGRAVPGGRLAGEVWDGADDPPAGRTAALQALVGRVRRALGREAVASVPGGYRLAAGRDDIDLFRFERLAAEGATALAADEPGRAAGILDEALALWDGPALADLPGHATDPRAVRAERGRREARRARLAAEAERGRPQEALAGLAALAAEHPLDEPLQAQRIRTLRAAGRPAEALQAYEDVRTGLADRLGTGPGPELRALYAELLTGGAPPPPARVPVRNGAPSARSTFHVGGGAATRAAGNLRAPLTSFVGRAAELAGLATALRTVRLVTLTGAGGAGKTRLALEAARAGAAAWPDGVWVAELAPVRDAGTVAETVLTALGARETVVRGATVTDGPAPADPLLQLAEHCAQWRVLILLDNCEQVIGAVAELAETVLTRCPGVTLLATSREPLGVPGETVRTVGPLPQDMALRLLAERGAAARTGFTPDDDPLACAEICRRLDGLPLAIELAAARLRAFAPRQLADRLDDRFRLLGPGSGRRTALPRQQTLRAVVDWSWDLLTEDERTVLRRLSVFAGGCGPTEAEAVCGPPAGTGSDDTPGLLASLVDKSLVVAEPAEPTAPDGSGGLRYRLLETVAEYAAERLDAAGERAAVAHRHLVVYREFARTGDLELRGRGQLGRLDRFEREHDNLRAALRTAVDRGEEQDALCLALSLSWFWQLRGHRGDAHTWSSAAAALGPDPFRTPVRPAVPLTEPCTGQPPPWKEEQLWEARRGVRLIVLWSDEAAPGELELPRTRARLRAMIDAYGSGLPQNCRQPGSLWFFARLMTGELPGLMEAMDALVTACRAQADAQSAGDGGAGGSIDWDLGLALMLRSKLFGDRPDGLDRSARDADEALALFTRTGDLVGIAESLAARAETYERQGRYEAAALDFERAMESCARVGAHAQVPLLKARLASVRLVAAPDPAARTAAEQLLVAAVEEAAEGRCQAEGVARLLLARHYARTGRRQAARSQLRALEPLAGPAAQTLLGGAVAGTHAWLDCLDGRYEEARTQSREAVRRLDALGRLVAPHLMAQQFVCAAWAKARLGEAADAARLLGAYARHTDRSEAPGLRPFPSPADPETLARAESAIRAALDEHARAVARAEGAALPVGEAAALV